MNIYGTPISPYVARVTMASRYKGIDFELIAESRESMARPEFFAINPMRKMPVLDNGDIVLPESSVICEYLDAKYPARRLIPEGPEEAAKVRLMVAICDLYIQTNVINLVPHMGRKARVQEDVDKYLAQLEQGLDSLEHYMEAGTFAAGDNFSMVECSVVPTLTYLHRILIAFGLDDPIGERPKLASYWKAMSEIEICAQTIQEIQYEMDELARQARQAKAAKP